VGDWEEKTGGIVISWEGYDDLLYIGYALGSRDIDHTFSAQLLLSIRLVPLSQQRLKALLPKPPRVEGGTVVVHDDQHISRGYAPWLT
jgi:hypothetical protein